jgi:hypothetical protein
MRGAPVRDDATLKGIKDGSRRPRPKRRGQISRRGSFGLEKTKERKSWYGGENFQ